MNVTASNKNGDTIHANISNDAIPHTIKISLNIQRLDIQEIQDLPRTGKPYITIPESAWHNTTK